MPDYTQDDRPLAVETPLGKDKLLLESVSGTEEMSRLFRFDLDLLSVESTISPEQVIGKQVSFRINREDGSPRWFNGWVSRFSWIGRDSRLTRWRAEVVPSLWFLTRTSDCKIWQEKELPAIVDDVLGDHPLVKFKKLLQGSYQSREYCVQYRETDFNFVSRLLEHAGIAYHFEHDLNRLTLVLADSATAYTQCGDGTVEFVDNFANPSQPGQLFSWQQDWSFRSGRYAQRDYNFEMPTTDLSAKQKGKTRFDGAADLEIYEYPGEYETKIDGEADTKIRIEEEESTGCVAHGVSACRTFSPGYTFKAPDGNRYLLTTVSHTASIRGTYESDGNEATFDYRNSFRCIPHETPFRPTRSMAKPIISGAQTAVVTGPPGEEIHPDKYGRVKVQFYWDRYGKKDDTSSCWIRVSQVHASSGWGYMDIPRVGEEVIVTFLEGDPDRPIITGRVYNAENMPPFSLPDGKTRRGNKTKTYKGSGYNEMSMDDTPGNEQIRIHGQYNMDTVVGNDLTEHVKVNRTRKVDNDEQVAVGNNKAVAVGTNHTETVGANQTVTVGSNQTNTVASNQSNSVGMNKTESVGVMSNELVGMLKTTNVGAAYSIISGAAMNTAVGFISAEEVGMTKKIIVGSKFEIVVGASKFTMDAGGKVTIEGKEFLFKAKGDVKIEGAIIDLN